MKEEQIKDFIDAIVSNDLLAIKTMMDVSRDCLDAILDDAGSHVLHIAAQYGHADIVDFLINAHKSQHSIWFFSTITHTSWLNQLDAAGKTPLMLALACSSYQTAHIIIHASLNENNHDTVFGAITSAEQVVELMMLDPSRTTLMLKNPRLKRMLTQAQNSDSATTPIGFYKFSGRRPSFYAEINQETGEVDILRPKRVLGRGKYAEVRLFTNKDGAASVAVKKPLPQALGTSEASIKDAMIDYTNEQTIMRRAYNNPPTCKLFHATQTNDDNEKGFELRSMMPHIHGEPVKTYLNDAQSPHELAQLILGMTKALMRLHERGIIHGDIKMDNIIISRTPCLEITFVDFGLSSLLTDTTVQIFPPQLEPATTAYIAPERFGPPRKVAPHTNQDVYSFAYNLENYIFKTKKECSAFKLLYPCIANFIALGQSTDPALRPSLASLHEALSNDINTKEPSMKIQATEVAHGYGTH